MQPQAVPAQVASTSELFALTDEQILDIAPESTQSAAVGQPLPGIQAQAQDGAATLSTQALPDTERASQPGQDQQAQQSAESLRPAAQTELAASQPPPWLAAQMNDPWSGAEAKEFWHGVQQ